MYTCPVLPPLFHSCRVSTVFPYFLSLCLIRFLSLSLSLLLLPSPLVIVFLFTLPFLSTFPSPSLLYFRSSAFHCFLYFLCLFVPALPHHFFPNSFYYTVLRLMFCNLLGLTPMDCCGPLTVFLIFHLFISDCSIPRCSCVLPPFNHLSKL